jgi:hypothetical protein
MNAMNRSLTNAVRSTLLAATLAAGSMVGIVATSLPAHALSSETEYCDTVHRMIDAGQLRIDVYSTDSLSTAITKITKFQNALKTVKKIAPADAVDVINPVIDDLTRMRTDVRNMLRYRSKISTYRAAFISDSDAMNADLELLSEDFGFRCGGGSFDDTESDTVA